MGKPKQELLFNGETLLQHAVKAAVATDCRPIAVVLGANTAQQLPEVFPPTVTVVQNAAWQDGISSSLQCGLSALLASVPQLEAVLFMVCDQPYVEAALLNKLVETKKSSGKGIIASHYNDTLGTPVLFDKAYFEELFFLRGQEGAKKLLFRHSEDVVPVQFPLGAVDIDTPSDYAFLIKSGSKA